MPISAPFPQQPGLQAQFCEFLNAGHTFLESFPAGTRRNETKLWTGKQIRNIETVSPESSLKSGKVTQSKRTLMSPSFMTQKSDCEHCAAP